ncbi:MAG: helix-turn-helix transcriptional regulator [Rhizobiaceae bacterium]|nr:helix-turn-helix transcriptional regulator [Rhizobiaceae bacterium]MCV0405860.1 helix-turn-helix transcriptional regulator [Rhizobiaceae bacterium]
MAVLSHDSVWAAIDALAERYAMSPSGLARRAGLDSTAFNKSKRRSADGRPRWPSTESIAKVIEATGATVDEFFGLMRKSPDLSDTQPVRRSQVPLLGLAQAGAGGFFDDAGFPAGEGWDLIEVPDRARPGTYALQVNGDSMLPLYRDSDVLIVDPEARIRKGDRVVVKTTGGEVTAKVLARQTSRLIELDSINPEHPGRTIPVTEIAWVARIVWASQ